MSVVCAIFVPTVVSVVTATSTIVSINLSAKSLHLKVHNKALLVVLVGLMNCYGADIDPVLMLNVIMAVGFSVDYTAHMTYHFYHSARRIGPDEVMCL